MCRTVQILAQTKESTPQEGQKKTTEKQENHQHYATRQSMCGGWAGLAAVRANECVTTWN